MGVELESPRLLLRQWADADRHDFAELNADPEVMEHFPQTLTHEGSNQMVELIRERFVTQPFGLWALEVKDTGEFIGFAGLSVPQFDSHFTPCVEVGWRLKRSAWDQGYATEAGTAALDHGFGSVGLQEVVSFTARTNLRSEAVMQRLGMRRDPSEDFAHPRLDADHPLSMHLLYRIGADEWDARGGS